MLNAEKLVPIQAELAKAGVDGWLIFDFHGLNPVALGMLELHGMATRRIFVFIPTTGVPVALTHAIEQGPWRDWPSNWERLKYSGWRELESYLAGMIKGKTVAMEYSAGDAVPYLDRIPAGVIEMVRAAGATIVSSADLVTQFYAVWTEDNISSHERAAEVVAEVAKKAMQRAGDAARNRRPVTEYELQQWILEQFAANKLSTDHGPIVAIGPNAADPHYETTRERDATINSGDILLIDLWAREDNGVFADQTWMGSLGEPGEKELKVWLAVRDARDAAISILRDRLGSGKPLSGGEVDDASRDVITSRGFGPQFIHRTGHSIDSRDLHGSGPHIDNLETRDERLLVPGIGFSIEPGVYLPGDVGMRSEVNAYVAESGVVITPREYQKDLIIV